MTARRSSALRLRMAFEDHDRRGAVAATREVALLAMEYVVDDASLLRHALDVARDWCAGQADLAGLSAARASVAEAASRADAGEDRGAFLAADAVMATLDAALEAMPALAAKHAWRAAQCAVEAASWPDVDDEAVVSEAEARVNAVLDRALPRRVELGLAVRRAEGRRA